jgi:hypothetical protein
MNAYVKNCNMENEKILTEKESLELITQMINKAKREYRETGVTALMWGSVITFCSLVTFAAYFLQWHWAHYVWWLTFVAVIPQIIISIKERKKRRYKTYNDDAMGGIWISFAIAIFLLSFYFNMFQVPSVATIVLVLYGVPTFATGYTRKFKPMILGGIACWAFAVASMYIAYPYPLLLTAGSALLAWFIPGLILRRRFLKAKEQHV